ncbi:MAG: hypothetical protein H6629_07680 [Calditrichae bacterium]|nr:hypothetical protein [Calditrichia bacterium]
MKLSNTIFMMVLFTFSSTIFAETMDVNIGNPRVEDGVFKFEVQFKRTDNWVNGFGQIGGLGDSDFYFNYNSEGFSGIPSLTAGFISLKAKIFLQRIYDFIQPFC